MENLAVKHRIERLESWLRRTETDRKVFAELIGVTVGALSRYCRSPSHRHFRRPHGEVMVAIYKATQGAVRPDSFYDLPDLAPRAAATSDEQQTDLVALIEAQTAEAA